MPFPFLAVAGAVTGLAGSLFSGSQQQSAARQANKLAEAQAKAQFKRAKKEWQIDYWQQKSNWMWDTARVEAAKYVERQKESDHNWRSQRLIESAMQNLETNSAALRDKFVVEEGLRAKQVGMEYGNTMDRLAAESGETVRQYMAGIRDSALQSMQMVNETEKQGQELMSSMVFDMQKDGLQWEINQVAALMDGSQMLATASARMGGSESAQRLAMNKAQELGRTWGEMEARSKQRDARVGLMNTAMQGETAVQMGRMALSMQDQAQKIQYTNDRYVSNAAMESLKMKELTVPSFQLAENQYGRELQALRIQTQGVVDEASMPYRKAIIFNPIEPIKGLKPEYMAPTKVYEPSTAGIIGQGLLSGIQGAISMGTYTKGDGTLGWR